MTYKITTTNKSFKTLLAEGNFDYKYIHSEFKPPKPSKEQTLEVELITFGKYTSSKEVLTEFEMQGLRMLSALEALTLANTYPNLQTEKPYATIFDSNDSDWFLAFGRWSVKRIVSCNRRGYGWHDYWWFAGVRKVSKNLDSRKLGASLPWELEINGHKYVRQS